MAGIPKTPGAFSKAKTTPWEEYCVLIGVPLLREEKSITVWAEAPEGKSIKPAAETIEKRPILPNRRVTDEKVGRPGASMSLMEELRIDLFGSIVSMALCVLSISSPVIGDGLAAINQREAIDLLKPASAPLPTPVKWVF
jgi:hypothetical protein